MRGGSGARAHFVALQHRDAARAVDQTLDEMHNEHERVLIGVRAPRVRARVLQDAERAGVRADDGRAVAGAGVERDIKCREHRLARVSLRVRARELIAQRRDVEVRVVHELLQADMDGNGDPGVFTRRQQDASGLRLNRAHGELCSGVHRRLYRQSRRTFGSPGRTTTSRMHESLPSVRGRRSAGVLCTAA